MTRDRDIDSVLDRFYADGPTAMPDRLFLGVIDRIERTPQRRLALQLTRFASMNRNLRVALAAAIVVAVVGIGAYALSKAPNVATQASPSPSIAGSPSVAGAAVVPANLQGRWVGAPRVVPEAPEPPYRNALQLTEFQMGFALAGQGSLQQFASTAALTGPDQLRFRGASTDGACRPGDEGTYAFNLAASGTVLTLTPLADACGPRSTALVGDWVKVGCTDKQGWCLGNLQPGKHLSTLFTPFIVPSAWTYNYGRFSYTTPAGWTNDEDDPGGYALRMQNAPPNTGIYIWGDVAAHGQVDQCKGGADPRVGRSADALVTWLGTLPGLEATAPQAATIGGLTGKQVDLSVKSSWTATCEYADPKGRSLVSTFSDPANPDGLDWNVQEDGHTRIIALDLGDGRAMIIDIEAQNQADFDALLPGAMEVVNTFTFSH